MFDPKLKCWVSGEYTSDLLKQSLEASNDKVPEALFIVADHYLSEGRKGNHTADAVYAMETAANLKYVDAVLAMGQMYHHGWGVHKSQKKAMYWYEVAAELGCAEAIALLNKLRRQKIALVLSAVTTVTVAAAGVALAILLPKLLPDAPPPKAPKTEPTLPNGVLVGENTELTTATNTMEFSAALSDIMKEYDTELVISGQQSTNRLILRFEGSGIDLSAFPAATVIANENSKLVIIQFTSEAEAKACLEALKEMSNVAFAETDNYQGLSEDDDDNSFEINANPPTYHSQYTGFDYYTWGCTFLEMDQMVAWTMTQPTQSVTVAVVDTGSQNHADFGGRLLPGADLTDPSQPNGWGDVQGHGSHVAGTILDCTQGLDVKVLPCRVFIGRQTSDALITLGIEHATDQKVQVTNLSLGGAGCSPSIEDAINRALQEGIVVVVSAGNEAMHIEPNNVCPAHNTNCITVSGCDRTGALYTNTNYGDCVDICAPAVDVVSYCLDGSFSSKNGTSMAAPHISAMAAIILTRAPHKTIEQIEKYLGDYAINPGDADYYGDGIPCGSYFAGD